jgi:hypothetical protein
MIVSREPLPQIGFTGTRHGMTPEQRSAVAAIVQGVAQGAGFGAHHGDCVGADAEFHDLCHMAPLSVIVVHPGPLDDLPNQAGRSGDSRREPVSHMRRNKNIVMASTVMIAAPFEMIQQAHGGTWRTIEMARSAKRPLAIVWRDGAVTRERWDGLPGL